MTRDYRDELKTAGLVALAPIIAAVPVGILWWLLAPVARLHYVDGSVLLSEGEGESAVAADGWFAVCAAVAGLVCAALVFARLRRARIGALVGLAVGGLLAAVLAWRLGVLLGPGAIRDSIKGLHSGAFFDGPLDVSAKGVLLLWPLASVVGYFALSAGLEGRDEEGRGRGETTGDRAEWRAQPDRPAVSGPVVDPSYRGDRGTGEPDEVARRE